MNNKLNYQEHLTKQCSPPSNPQLPLIKAVPFTSTSSTCLTPPNSTWLPKINNNVPSPNHPASLPKSTRQKPSSPSRARRPSLAPVSHWTSMSSSNSRKRIKSNQGGLLEPSSMRSRLEGSHGLFCSTLWSMHHSFPSVSYLLESINLLCWVGDLSFNQL